MLGRSLRAKPNYRLPKTASTNCFDVSPLTVRVMYVYQRTLSFTRHLRTFIGLNSRKRISRVFQLLVVAGRFSYYHFLRESSQRRTHLIYNFSFFNAADGRIDDRKVFNGRYRPGILQLLRNEIRSEIIDDTWNVIN